MLGRVALVQGDIDTAESELLAAARVPGSPQLASFGPNMQLAFELLQAGRREAVLEYFRLCGDFWEMSRSQLRVCSTEVGKWSPTGMRWQELRSKRVEKGNRWRTLSQTLKRKTAC